MCSSDLDHQLELDWGLNGKLARFLALEDAIGVRCGAPIRIELVNSVGQQAAEFSEDSARGPARQRQIRARTCREQGLRLPLSIISETPPKSDDQKIL